MNIIINVLITQWIILIWGVGWIKLDFNPKNENLPRFITAILLLFIPFSVIFTLLKFLYNNDKNNGI